MQKYNPVFVHLAPCSMLTSTGSLQLKTKETIHMAMVVLHITESFEIEDVLQLILAD